MFDRWTDARADSALSTLDEQRIKFTICDCIICEDASYDKYLCGSKTLVREYIFKISKAPAHCRPTSLEVIRSSCVETMQPQLKTAIAMSGSLEIKCLAPSAKAFNEYMPILQTSFESHI